MKYYLTMHDDDSRLMGVAEIIKKADKKSDFQAEYSKYDPTDDTETQEAAVHLKINPDDIKFVWGQPGENVEHIVMTNVVPVYDLRSVMTAQEVMKEAFGHFWFDD